MNARQKKIAGWLWTGAGLLFCNALLIIQFRRASPAVLETLRDVIRWIWLIVCVADCLASGLAWLELRKKRDRSFYYLARVMFSDAFRALTSVIGLYLFGINVQSNLWYIVLGLAAAVSQGASTIGWLLYVRGIINGGGWLGLLRREKLDGKSISNA
jgi:hypothetical protein